MAEESRFPFTKTRLAGLPVPDAGRAVYRDTHTPGLILRITENDQRSFYFYRKVKGRPMRLLLGKFPEMTVEKARNACHATAGQVSQGKDPQAERRSARHEQNVEGLWKYWLDNHAKAHKKSWREDERMYRLYLVPWANRRLSAIRKTDVQSLLHRIATGAVRTSEKKSQKKSGGKYQANRVHELIRAMYGKAPDIGYRGENPALGIKRFPEEKRDRFLHADELRGFFAALAAEPSAMLRDFFFVALLTGARRSNVQTMQWPDIDFQAGIWRIPETKSGRPVVVPLVAPVANLLRTRLQFANGSPWVFPSRGKTGHVVEPKSAWKRIIKRAGLVDVRPHDLRRSLGSWMAITGAGLPIVGKMLGHTQASTTMIYARLSVDPVRQAAETATAAMLEAGGVTIDGLDIKPRALREYLATLATS